MAAQPPTRLARRLGLADAVVVGLGAMLGTGVFVVFAPAADRAGSALLVSLLLAAGVAYCNALSSAQLAALYPQAGGTYVYGRERIGPSWGAAAGYAFIAGKTASSGAAAIAVGVYAVPSDGTLQRLISVLAVFTATTLNLLGVTRTVGVTRVLVAVLLLVLGGVVCLGLISDAAEAPTDAFDSPDGVPGVLGVLGAAALLFFAFAGYARIATLGEEVRDPAVTIPRAIPLALGIVLITYVAVAMTALLVLGPTRLAESTAPLVEVVTVAGYGDVAIVVRLAGAVAAYAVLLGLLAGVSRTAFAMAANRDLPATLADVSARYRVPSRAIVVIGIVVLAIALAGGLVGAVAFSAFTVLVYYAITNAAALRLHAAERRIPRVVPTIGLPACCLLALSLPWQTILSGVMLLLALLLVRATVMRPRGGRETPIRETGGSAAASPPGSQ
jgi:APA family basic amino acid/polyamine antiporter